MNNSSSDSSAAVNSSPGSASWTSTIDAAGAARLLRSARSAVLLTHAKPDGDAAGSTLAVARSLNLLGVSARVCYVGPTPRWLGTIAGDTRFQTLDPASRRREPAMTGIEADLVVITDTGSWSQLDETRAWIEPRRERTLVIDHHLHGDPDVAAHKFLGLGQASTTQVLAPVCCELLGCAAAALPEPVAEALYLGLATDTQWFKLSNVSPRTLRLAGDLLDAGVNHTRLYELIEQQDVVSRWKLLGRALMSLELHNSGRVALMRIMLSDFGGCGADRNDTSGFADMVLHIASVQVAVVLSEAEVAPGEPPTCKVSMRSKPGDGAIDVNQVTMTLGGGGHARAAGAKMTGVPIDEARERVLAALRGV